MQAKSEISVLHLTNDRLSCSLAFNYLCGLLGLLYEGRHLSLCVRRKITVNVFIQRLQTFFFIFVTVYVF